VQREFLDCAPENSKYIGLDCEYIDTVKNVKQGNLPSKKKQWTALLQLSMPFETLVFQICHADAV
jgi:hypothetical protein